MTQARKDEVVRLMSQMDVDLQSYVIDTLRHLKFAQNTLAKKGKPTYGPAKKRPQ
jgi:hypothetical protein